MLKNCHSELMSCSDIVGVYEVLRNNKCVTSDSEFASGEEHVMMTPDEVVDCAYDKSWIGGFPNDKIEAMRVHHRAAVEREAEEMEERRKEREKEREEREAGREKDGEKEEAEEAVEVEQIKKEREEGGRSEGGGGEAKVPNGSRPEKAPEKATAATVEEAGAAAVAGGVSGEDIGKGTGEREEPQKMKYALKRHSLLTMVTGIGELELSPSTAAGRPVTTSSWRR